MDNLNTFRKEILELDKQILQLLSERGTFVQKIGIEKQKLNLKIYNSKREKDLIVQLKSSNKGPYNSMMIECIFKTIFKVSKELQVKDNLPKHL
ncbi:chorismate mutase [Bacillus cereus]|uniref:Chorismate mutase n=1 Tax=Bacillus cereus TaxID=1396 RepID=A0AB34D3E3_BACCE|nr:chorismate mutase [Bacillus cereus]KAB2492577.1 chorismate mutase [Bacillus cereus]